ncbi:putative Heterokaryon incompatibility protein-domain-containing protein [Seiridium cardinale]
MSGNFEMDSVMEKEAARKSSPAGIEWDLLKQWHQVYSDATSDFLDANSHLVLAVESDDLDLGQIETAVQQLISTAEVVRGLCAKCRHLLDHWPDLATGVWATAVGRPCHTHEVEAATRAGCRFCSFLLYRLRAAELFDTFRKIENRLRILKDPKTASLSVSNWGVVGSFSQLLWWNFPAKVTKHGNSPAAYQTIFESHVLSPSANLWDQPIDQFDLIKTWIRECSSSHKNCRSIKKHEPPTRLVSVDNDTVKLVLTADMEKLPRYATLSYSWGQQEFLMLTSENLGSFLNEIPLEDLPRTLREAVNIARELEISYIWIDALCIIQAQDDQSDWVHESSQMHSIYGGGYVNLAASSATNVHEGFFTKPIYHNCGFCARTTTSEYCRVQNFHSTEVYEESSTRSYLASRAWTFQEKLLSTRTVYFGDHGLFWECRSRIKSEFLPDGFPGKLGSHLVCPEDKSWNWLDIVRNYSKANLTLTSDRLPALSGIAKRQHEITGHHYLAGMWKQNLVYQLPWAIVSVRGRTNRPNSGVPTWSWASTNSPTSYWVYWDGDATGTKEHIRVLEAWTIPASTDPFGAVAGGKITIACSGLVKGRVYRTANIQRAFKIPGAAGVLLEEGMQLIPFQQDCREDVINTGNDTVYMLPVFSGHSGSSKIRKKTHDEASIDDSDSNWEPEDEDDYDSFPKILIRGIVLQRCDKTKGHFRRLGSFDLNHDTDPHRFPKDQNEDHDNFLRFIETVAASTAEVECAKVLTDPPSPEFQFVITIE